MAHSLRCDSVELVGGFAGDDGATVRVSIRYLEGINEEG